MCILRVEIKYQRWTLLHEAWHDTPLVQVAFDRKVSEQDDCSLATRFVSLVPSS